MLINDSFIFLSIPRCATRAFEISCVNSGLDIKYYSNSLIKKDFNSKLPELHSHNKVSALRSKFGLENNFNVISISRDPIERYISAWKYIIHHFGRIDDNYGNILSTIKNEDFIDIFNGSVKSIYDVKNRDTFNKMFNKIITNVDFNEEKFTNIFHIFRNIMLPPTYWNENDVRITYFNINDTELLENYVKDNTGKDFKMIKTNDTNSVKTLLINNDIFNEFYYTKIEVPHKSLKSLI